MFINNSDKNKLIDWLRGSYRKFKSYVYYQNDWLFIKEKIATFEADETTMEATFAKLAMLLSTKSLNLDQLKKQISVELTIKKATQNPKGDILAKSLNAFIDAPMEVYILDTFWTIQMIRNSRRKTPFYQAANVIDEELFHGKSIDYDSLALFEPYFPNYQKWNQQAIEQIKDRYNAHEDSIFLLLDLHRYFYSVDIKFDILKKKYPRSQQIINWENTLWAAMKTVYTAYSSRLSEFYSEINGRTVLPIGLMSSCFLSNEYLREFDEEIVEKHIIPYYCRYVDDMVFVFPNTNKKDFTTSEEVLHYYLHNQIQKDPEGNYSLVLDQNLHLNMEKTQFISFSQSDTSGKIDAFAKENLFPSSVSLIPTFDNSLSALLSTAFSTNPNSDEEGKAGETIPKQELAESFYSFLKLHKNTENDEDAENSKRIFDQYSKFFTPIDLIRFSEKWQSIYCFCAIQSAGFDLYNNIDKKIEEAIESVVPADPEFYQDKATIGAQLKNSLTKRRTNSAALALAINPRSETAMRFARRDLILNFRKSNLFKGDHSAFPLGEYLSSDSINLFDYNECLRSSSSLSDFKIRYSPKFVHCSDFIDFDFERNPEIVFRDHFLKDEIDLYEKQFTKLEKMRVRIELGQPLESLNSLGQPISIQNEEAKNNDPYQENESSESDPLIALINEDIDQHNILTKKEENPLDRDIHFNVCTLKKKKELIDLLNDTYALGQKWDWIPFEKKNTEKKSVIRFLLFPECAVPIQWLPELEAFSRKTGIVVICGMEYLKYKKYVFDIEETIIPFKSPSGYASTISIPRAKNDYAPFEQRLFAQNSLIPASGKKHHYNLFNVTGIKCSFAPYICYELTDIVARGIFRNNVDLIMACEYNADISYFSDIIKATSRDLTCFVAQANSSNYGDTSLIIPGRTYTKIAFAISKGETPSVNVAKMPLEKQKIFLNWYNNHFISGDNEKCPSDADIFHKPSAGYQKK